MLALVPMDLLVSHRCGRYSRARREILRTLTHLGDDHAAVERTSVEGIALVHTALEARSVVHGCRELSLEGRALEEAIKWVPVDYWCETDLQAMYRLLEEKVRDQIAPDETWAMQIEKRRWQRYHTREIVVHLAGAIDRKVDLDRPDKLVRVDVVGGRVAVSVLRPGEVFSITAPRQLAAAPARHDTYPSPEVRPDPERPVGG